jgi:hypothetical protein
MHAHPPRVVTLVLVDAAGTVLGALPPFVAATPAWRDTAPIVDEVHQRFGLQVVVLRLLAAEGLSGWGGAVTCLAQPDPATPAAELQPWSGELPENPMRHPYARFGLAAAPAGARLQNRASRPDLHPVKPKLHRSALRAAVDNASPANPPHVPTRHP